jgi:ABC-2 type transport system permease protein
MSLFRQEMIKTAFKWRTYIGFAAIAVVVPLIQFGFKIEGGGMIRALTRGISQDFLLFGNLFNGYFLTHFIMNGLWIHIPFLITLVAGDMLAGEATGGTFRLLLTRPVSRTRILATKYLVALLYTTSLVVFLGILSLVLGVSLFGTGDLIVPGKDLLILPESDVPPRLLLAFVLATVSMWSVSSLAFLLSSLVENAIGPIIGSMAVIIVCLLISTIDLTLFTAVKPYLFTTYMNVWKMATEDPLPIGDILQSVGVLLAYCAGFFGLSWVIFVRKDILS